MALETDRTPPPRSGAVREILVYGLVGGLLIAVVKVVEARFLGAESSFALYGGVIAVLFAAVGLWLGASLRRGRPAVIVREVPVDGPAPEVLVPDEARRDALGITPRELEILEHIAAGLSNREIAEALFVSENTVKTHASRLFDKLGARRRTQAVQIGKENRLLP